MLRLWRWLTRVWIERDDYRARYEHQYEMKCKVYDELDALEEVHKKCPVWEHPSIPA